MSEIRVAITGVGNCASALIQGVEYYKDVMEEVIDVAISDSSIATTSLNPLREYMNDQSASDPTDEREIDRQRLRASSAIRVPQFLVSTQDLRRRSSGPHFEWQCRAYTARSPRSRISRS